MQENVLSWITFLPLIGMVAILFVPKTNTSLIKGIALGATGLASTAKAVDEKDLRKIKGIIDAITGDEKKVPSARKAP